MSDALDAFSHNLDPSFATIDWNSFARRLLAEAGIPCTSMERADGTDHVVFLVDGGTVLKIFGPWRNCFERECKALEFLAGRLPVTTPEVLTHGRFEGLDHIVMTRVPGRRMDRAEFLSLPFDHRVSILKQLADVLNIVHSLDPAPFADDWAEFVAERALTFVDRQIAHGVNPRVVAELPRFIEENLSAVPIEPTQFLHSDVHFANLRFTDGPAGPVISGLFDLADSRRGFREYEFLAIGVLMIQGERELQREFFRACGYHDHEMDEEMRRRLMMLTMLYETSDLRRYAMRLRPEAVEYTLDELEREIWSFV
jgi:aminoglycoside phosphotransferase (APT) family kinase protein